MSLLKKVNEVNLIIQPWKTRCRLVISAILTFDDVGCLHRQMKKLRAAIGQYCGADPRSRNDVSRDFSSSQFKCKRISYLF